MLVSEVFHGKVVLMVEPLTGNREGFRLNDEVRIDVSTLPGDNATWQDMVKRHVTSSQIVQESVIIYIVNKKGDRAMCFLRRLSSLPEQMELFQ